MTTVDCISVFSETEYERERATAIDDLAPDCCCENKPVTKHSESPVLDSEYLIRIIVDDTHIKCEDGVSRLKSSFFQDATTVGASTLRLGKASRREFEQTVKLLTEGKTKKDGSPKTIIGYVLISAKQVREFTHALRINEDENRAHDPNSDSTETLTEKVMRVLSTYATGYEDRPHHSDVFSCNCHLSTRSGRTRHAVKFGELVADNFTTIDDIEELYCLADT